MIKYAIIYVVNILYYKILKNNEKSYQHFKKNVVKCGKMWKIFCNFTPVYF